jgi:hypothetical protein
MKWFKIIIFTLISINGYSQKLTSGNIVKYSLSEIYDEIIKDKYTTADSKLLAIKLSEFDKSKGIKRVLSCSDMFTTTCMKCLYNNVGFEVVDFYSCDIRFTNVDTFVNCYNRNMRKLIPKEELYKIDNYKYNNDKIFEPFSIGQSQYEIQTNSDSDIYLKIKNETLEGLLGDEVKKVKIYFVDSLFETYKSTSYNVIKNFGVRLNMKYFETGRISLVFDLSEVPDKLNICWCSALDKKYYAFIKVKIK